MGEGAGRRLSLRSWPAAVANVHPTHTKPTASARFTALVCTTKKYASQRTCAPAAVVGTRPRLHRNAVLCQPVHLLCADLRKILADRIPNISRATCNTVALRQHVLCSGTARNRTQHWMLHLPARQLLSQSGCPTHLHFDGEQRLQLAAFGAGAVGPAAVLQRRRQVQAGRDHLQEELEGRA